MLDDYYDVHCLFDFNKISIYIKFIKMTDCRVRAQDFGGKVAGSLVPM